MGEGVGRVLTFACRGCGKKWSADVWCRHDVENATRKAMDAHRARFGADCLAIVDVNLLDAETMEPDPAEHALLQTFPPFAAPPDAAGSTG